jgi:hypothetical protein
MTKQEIKTAVEVANDTGELKPSATSVQVGNGHRKRMYQCRTLREFTAAIKEVPSPLLLELRFRAFEKYSLDCLEPHEEVGISVTQVREMSVTKRIAMADSAEAGRRRVLLALDTEIHSRQLWLVRRSQGYFEKR